MPNINQLQEYNLTAGQINLLFRLRVIWRDIATWMRAYLVYVFLESDPQLKQAAAKKLTDLPIAYANVFRVYFGDEIADQHTILMSTYANLLIALIDATKNGDEKAVMEYKSRINDNINERVNFLTNINPFWDKAVMSNLLNGFNTMAINEINTFANREYLNNIDLFSSLLSYSDRMGNYFTEGILKYYTFNPRVPRIP